MPHRKKAPTTHPLKERGRETDINPEVSKKIKYPQSLKSCSVDGKYILILKKFFGLLRKHGRKIQMWLGIITFI